MPKIGPNAFIDPNATLADDVIVGPNCFVGANVTIGAGCKLLNNVTLLGPTVIGEKNEFFPNCVIGADPQDLKYKGGPTELIIGSNNVFRENVTVNRGTELGGGKTVIGSGNLFMAGVHVGHDCIIEDHIVAANNVLLGGHLYVERCAFIGGAAAVHHFCSIGKNAMIGGLSAVVADVPPFTICDGNPAAVRAINVRGLMRNGFTEGQIDAVKETFKKLFRSGKFLTALAELEASETMDVNVKYLVDFMRRSTLGKHGRYREALRCDSMQDIGDFYKDKKSKAGSQG
jgi:UDP-N-acetylglucosamine acyltransferase